MEWRQPLGLHLLRHRGRVESRRSLVAISISTNAVLVIKAYWVNMG